MNKSLPVVDERRLLEKLRARLERPGLTLRRPPAAAEDPYGTQPAFTVWRFPRWFLVQKPEPTPSGTRRRLVHQSRLDQGRFRDGQESYDVVPIRFVRACEHGHADDIDWPTFVHRVPGGCDELFIEERSTTGELAGVWVDCGYPASSLRERVYALKQAPDVVGRYGVLIFTGSSDAEGTLGGLAAAARHIKSYVRQALEMATLCSNDPVCAHHQPGQHDHAPLLGAACHRCLLVPATSCEHHDEFLDRALVVPTVEHLGAEFFPANL